MKILITGAAGFIGMHLCKKLLDLGFEVIGLDNINSYYDIKLKKNKLKNLYNKNKKFKFYEIDILDNTKLTNIFNDNDFDYVVHLAAQAGVRYSIEKPRTYIDSNLIGFFNILELSKSSDIKNFFYASSSSVYGLNENHPWKEDDMTDTPVALYGATKKANELMASSYSHLYDINATGLRFFTVYGPWGRPDMSLFLFVDAIFNDKEIQLFNNGNMIRDFTYIDDVISSIIKLIETDVNKTDVKNSHQIFNIGTGNPIKLRDYIQVIENEIGKKAKIKNLPMQMGDIKVTSADNEKLKKFINYVPNTSVVDGIRNFVKWYKDYYES